MDKDPVSGNDIPPGSLAKEVRDDIPAQLSEGEYVVPADVVQYYGVKFFEDLRTEAKRGLAEMDRDGRIGGEPVAVTMIATSGKEALSPKEEEQLREFMNASQGGLTGYAPGGAVTSSGQQLNQSSFNPANWAVVGGMPRGGGFQNQPAAVTYVTYVHKTDTTKPSIQVPIVNGQVQQGFVVPPDYIPQSQYSPPKPKSGGGKKGGGQGTMNKPDNDPWGTTEEYNWNDWKEEDFLKEAEKQLGKSGGEKLGQVAAGLVAGPVGYIAAGTYNNVDGIARTRAMALVAKARGLDEVASKLTTEADEAVEKSGWLTKFIDKMGWMDGQNKFNTISKKYDNFTTASTPVTDPISTSAVSKTDQSLTKNLATNKKKKDDIRAGFMSSPSIIQSTNEIIKKSKNPEDTQKNLDELTQKIASGSSVGFKEGGLLTKPKPKRKSRKPSGKGLGNK